MKEVIDLVSEFDQKSGLVSESEKKTPERNVLSKTINILFFLIMKKYFKNKYYFKLYNRNYVFYI